MSKIVKNVPELIIDLEKIRNGQLSPSKLKNKIDRLEFQYDSSDGFENILDLLHPFIVQLSMYPDYLDRELLVKRIEKLIHLLKTDACLEEFKEIPLRTDKKISRIDVDPLLFFTLLALILTFIAGLFYNLFS